MGLLLGASLMVRAQSGLFPSRMHFESELEGQSVNAESNQCAIQLNEQNAELAVRVRTASINSEDDSVNDVLIQSIGTIFFRCNFPFKDISYTDRQNPDNTQTVSGNITINKITKPVTLVMKTYALNQGTNPPANTVYPVHIDFEFEFNPKDFNLQASLKSLVNPVKVIVQYGFINKTFGGMENLFEQQQ